ncbi:acetylornithine deacetylase [Erwinia sp. SLM-02]|uniref:acetylornithine deacetylase n=1 Tax=Erwinia sp. SLM-02 TaxID=3020057 RepID=UPI0028D828EE|nr:acetylornithine deacetylase [uncultured Erwinia sp.]
MSSPVRDLLAKLLAFDTTSRESNLALIHFIQGWLAEHGVTARLLHNDSGSKANLYARIGPEGAGGVMLSGHTDVVPVDGQAWSVPPFALTERHGRYYGRGSTDMKGFLACVLAAVPEFVARPLRQPLHLAFSYDEEVGCLGVRSLTDLLADAVDKPALCIIGEPTEMRPVYGHKGKVAMRCDVRGHACHSAYAPQGVNAIEYASRLIARLMDEGERLAEVQDSRFDPAFSTLQVGTISGGAALNIVPQSCQFDFEIRHLPDAPADAVIDRIRQYALQALLPTMRQKSDDCSVTFQPLSRYPGLLTDPHSAPARLLAEWSGSDCFTTVAFGTEGGLFHEAGITTLVCGPGSMEQGHKADEYVSVAQLESCMNMLGNLTRWLRA